MTSLIIRSIQFLPNPLQYNVILLSVCVCTISPCMQLWVVLSSQISVARMKYDHVKCKGEVKLQGRFFINNEAREGEGENYNKGCMSCIIFVAVARFYYWLTSK